MTDTRTTVKCRRCGNEWLPRVAEPKRCPHCNSPRWQTPKPVGAIKNCARCGVMWVARVADPRKCPVCGSYKWEGEA